MIMCWARGKWVCMRLGRLPIFLCRNAYGVGARAIIMYARGACVACKNDYACFGGGGHTACVANDLPKSKNCAR